LFLETFPNAKGNIRRVIADGDIVAVHAHWTGLISRNGDVGVDIFRIKDGKLVEHWDVIAPIPDTSKNNNTMF
jgi:predicted SnoaL-like aldol condensation-catalyzing enzyme